jgi:hypothetical protein
MQRRHPARRPRHTVRTPRSGPHPPPPHQEPTPRPRPVHDTCAITGCQRPFSWTEIHHPHWWSRGGNTDLHNALPLCGHHHQRAHDPTYDLHRRPDGEWAYHRRTRCR